MSHNATEAERGFLGKWENSMHAVDMLNMLVRYERVSLPEKKDRKSVV